MGWTVSSAFAIVGLAILYLSTLIVFVFEAEDIIKCVTFPEMYVFEYVGRLINGV